MAEKVVRSKNLKKTNQGVDGRFFLFFFFFFLLLLLLFFTNRVRNVIEKATRNQRFENNGVHIYLIYDQQFRKILSIEEKKATHISDMAKL